MNDPTCKLQNNPRHTCTDKFGQVWDRPGSGPRPGTRCSSAIAIDQAVATLQAELRSPQFAEAFAMPIDKSARMNMLGELLASTMDPEDDNDDCENAR